MIKIGIIGMGWAGNTHAKYLKTRDDVRIAALCEPSSRLLEVGLEQYGGKGFDDFEPMLRKTKLDAVWLCTPSTVRREPLLMCAERGIPVFCEKPVERRLDVAEEIAAQLAERRANVQVGFVFRAMPLAKEAKKAFADDKIHLIQSLYCCPVGLTRELAPWFYDHSKSGGALVDQAIHNLDLLRYFFGEVEDVVGMAANPVRAKGDGYTVDEVFSLSLRFRSGALCCHGHSWVADKWRNQIVFIGEQRVYRLDLWAGRLIVKEKKGTWDFQQDQEHLYDYENMLFVDQVKSGDWSRNPSPFHDALETLRLAIRCDALAAR